LITDRVKAGIAHARARGVIFGRPRSIAIEAQVRELHGEGKSLRQIAAAVKRSPAGVFKILKRDQRSPGAPVS